MTLADLSQRSQRGRPRLSPRQSEFQPASKVSLNSPQARLVAVRSSQFGPPAVEINASEVLGCWRSGCRGAPPPTAPGMRADIPKGARGLARHVTDITTLPLQFHSIASTPDDTSLTILPRIQNPLSGIPRSTLLRDVETFATENGLSEHLALIQKGALVAQDPTNYEDISGEFALTEDEIEVLRDEVLHKWRQTRTLYLTIFTCSIGAAVQGWDQTGSNGANLSMPAYFNIGTTSVHDTLLLGLVNSGPYIGSSFFGCWISDPLNNYLGRRGAIFVAAIFCFIPVIGSAFTRKWYELLACRLLLGFGMGAKGSTVPIFAAENSPATIRGALVMTWQLWTAFGIFLGYSANLAVAHVGKNAWRLQLGSAMIPAIPLILFVYLCPESPRWYMSRFPKSLLVCVSANTRSQKRVDTPMHSSLSCGSVKARCKRLGTCTTSTRNLKSRRISSARATMSHASSSSLPFLVFAVQPSLRSL